MHSKFILLILVCALMAGGNLHGQTIKGMVTDKASAKALQDASVVNIYSSLTVNTNSGGEFVIAADSDELLEIRKPGYKTARVRIPKGYLPPYFKILLEQGFSTPGEVQLAQNNRYDNRADSLRYRELYRHELDFERLSTVGKISHPFSAMSKRNREIWRFQESYEEFEQEKYIDKTFNAATVAKFTGLTGDSLRVYMVRYRPTYNQLRNMNDYTFFTFIRHTSKIFRTPNNSRSSQ
jgi:hypothetical protein